MIFPFRNAEDKNFKNSCTGFYYSVHINNFICKPQLSESQFSYMNINIAFVAEAEIRDLSIHFEGLCQFAKVLGTRTLAQGPLFLIGDFQKLHPRNPPR